jgi:1-acyl-sn-glycerol-3-phosphate acyltransferase
MRPKHRTGRSDTDDTAAVLLNYVQEVARELHPSRAAMLAVTLDSSLERELGLDSLGRVELLQRLEGAFDVHLPEQLLATAETPRDLLRAVQTASPAVVTEPVRQPRHAALQALESTPEHVRTLPEALEWHVQEHPERPHIYLYGEAGQEDIITYGALCDGARAVAAGLQARDLQPGQTVGLMLPTCQQYFESFFGILLAGGIPVTIYPPVRPSQLEDHLRRQAGILSNARSVMLITVPEARPLARLLQAQVSGLRSVVTAQELRTDTHTYVRPPLQAQDIAFVQYTSGSTGRPKGVILTHANLLANIHAMNQVVRTTSSDVFVSWLPLYHDMGLIGAWLGSLYCGYLLVLMSPLTFLAHPERWLWAFHRHRGTISGAPNFAYELCVRRIDDAALEGLDLGSWRLAFNGAEPISPETLARFSERFARYGFRSEAMVPVYGLAEASLGVTFPPPGRGLRLDRIKREPFMRTGQAVPADQEDAHALQFVGCGQPLPGHEVRIVDATGFEVAERQQGRLEFRGPSATSGYLNNPDETRRLFHGDWVDSGDLAYVAEGEVYLTGRAKDIIIRAGRNLYPHELEEAIGNLAGIRRGCVAVFGSPDPVSRTERLVVLAETRDTDPAAREAMRGQIDALVLDLLGAPADDVVLALPHTVLKTSSGKIRRAASRELYEGGRIGERQNAVWLQVTRLALAGVRPQLRRLRQATTQVLYTAYAWAVVGLLAPPAWSAVVLLPWRPWRQAVMRWLARLLLKLTGIPLLVQGLEHIPQHQPCVLVVNHASYLDFLILIAALLEPLSYVAKYELSEQFITSLPMRRFGVEFVERFDVQRGVEDTARLVKAVCQGRSMVFFPEGTFWREPGLHPFHMGAFVVAAQAGVPVVPMALRGTRSILRADQWFPRRGPVRLSIGTPLAPTGSDWAAAIALRDAARVQILQGCGEPDLEPAAEPDRSPPGG